jgi:hypothetical protein
MFASFGAAAAMLTLTATMAAAETSVRLYQLQTNCQKLAGETFRREAAYDEDRIDYRAHYNARLNKCLYVETYRSPTPVGINKWVYCPTFKRIEFTAGFTGPRTLAFFTAVLKTKNAAQKPNGKKI